MALNTLGDSQMATATAAFTDKAGNPVSPVTPPPVWASADTTLLTVDGSGDPTGMTAVVKAVGPLGTVIGSSCTYTPAVGSPVALLFDVQIVAEGAITGNVTIGTPTEQ